MQPASNMNWSKNNIIISITHRLQAWISQNQTLIQLHTKCFQIRIMCHFSYSVNLFKLESKWMKFAFFFSSRFLSLFSIRIVSVCIIYIYCLPTRSKKRTSKITQNDVSECIKIETLKPEKEIKTMAGGYNIRVWAILWIIN